MIFVVFLAAGYFLVPKSSPPVAETTPSAATTTEASALSSAELEKFHQQNDPLLLAFLQDLKIGEKIAGLKLSDGRVLFEESVFLGHNMKYGAYLFKHHDLYQAVVTLADIELPTCDNFDEPKALSGEIHTHKTSKDYPVITSCPPKEWLQDLK